MEFKRKRVNARIYRVDEEELTNLKRRTDVAAVVIVSLLAIIVARLWFLQIHRGEEYDRRANTNRVRVLDIPASRGNILDRKGRVLVTNRPSFNIVWNKEDTPDPEAMLKHLARITGEDLSLFWERIREAEGLPRHFPVVLKEDIPWPALAAVENHRLELPGIRIEALPVRDYLYRDLGAHLIGYLGEINARELKEKQWDSYERGDQIGKQGMEKLFEEYLRGEEGREYMEVNALGFEQRRLKGEGALPGDDIQLTLDLDLQQVAEQGLADTAGAVVAMEVESGRVLALASAPTMELDKFLGGISQKNWDALLNNPLRPLLNKPIMGQYPPGSTYKIITALAALAEGIVTPETSYYCSGSIPFGNRRYGCWKESGHGPVNLHKALAESCDVYFYQIGQRLDVDVLASYAERLGLGRKTGIELEHEKGGLVPTKEWKRRRKKEAWQKGETLSVVIGQGFNLATPLQICRMTAAVANGGTLYRPRLVERILRVDGVEEHHFSPEEVGRVEGREQALALIRKGLVAAVNGNHGTGGAAKMEQVTVAGKTGTAQVVRLSKYKDVPDDKIPYKYRDHAWFTCYAPAEKPEIAVTVLVEHGGHGGSAAAPIARQVLEAYFNGSEESGERSEE